MPFLFLYKNLVVVICMEQIVGIFCDICSENLAKIRQNFEKQWKKSRLFSTMEVIFIKIFIIKIGRKKP